MHRGQQTFCLRVEVESAKQGFQRRKQQRQRGSQFVTDVREEAAFDLVQFNELLVAFFQSGSAFIQLEPEGKFAKPRPALGMAAQSPRLRRSGLGIEVVANPSLEMPPYAAGASRLMRS
jgi:hypothetical protein